MKLSIIIPVYNEEATIGELVRRIESTAFGIEYEIVIVDDASNDATYEKEKRLQAANSARIQLIRSPLNRGKGASIKEGLRRASGDIIIIQDADLEYNPGDIPALIEPILKGGADAVFGSRFLGKVYPAGMSLRCYLANRLLTLLTNILYSARLTDIETCYKAIKGDIIRDMDFKARRFEFEPEITAMLIKRKVAIRELPISYHARPARAGKKIKMKDFFIALAVLLKHRLKI